jgi:hypothetical protein
VRFGLVDCKADKSRHGDEVTKSFSSVTMNRGARDFVNNHLSACLSFLQRIDTAKASHLVSSLKSTMKQQQQNPGRHLLRLRAAFSRGNSESSFEVTSHNAFHQKEGSRLPSKAAALKRVMIREDLNQVFSNNQEPRSPEECKLCFVSVSFLGTAGADKRTPDRMTFSCLLHYY